MTVSMTFLQMPSTSAAAVVIHPRRHQHDSETISSHSIDDILKISDPHGENMRQSDSLTKRTRLRKRHSEYLYIQHHLEESSTDLEWLNPCNGFFEPSSEESNSFVPPPSYFLGRLRMLLSKEFHNINGTMKAINTDDMKPWSSYKDFYSFLPKIQLNSSIALKRWYRQMQMYVATFAHLGRLQYKYDRSKRMSASELTHELNELLLSARSILCEIETTINGSYPFPLNQKKLQSFTRDEMNMRLQFLTPQRHNRKDVLVEPEMLDLRFAKFRYIKFLRRMWRIIRMKTKRRGQHHLRMRTSEESSDLSFSVFDENISSSINELNLRAASSGSTDSFVFSDESGSHAGKKTNKRNKRQRRQRNVGRKSVQLSQ